MARPNMKSVRLSDEALAIVNSAEGTGFNDKFENLIFAYANTIPDRLAQLAAIDRQIILKKKELESLKNLTDKASYISQQFFQMENMINVAYNVSHELAQASAGTKVNEIYDYNQITLNEYKGDIHEEDFNDDDMY